MEKRHHSSHHHHRPTILNINEIKDSDLENYDYFTPDDEYFTPPTTFPGFSQKEYQSCTLNAFNKPRKTILPIFPPRSTLQSMVSSSSSSISTTATMTASSISHPTSTNEQIDFLLCNVPSKKSFKKIFSIFLIVFCRTITYLGTISTSPNECLYSCF